MSPTIVQNVVPRHRTSISHNFSRKISQRGSFNSATITLAFSLTAIISVSVLSFLYLGQVLGTASQGSEIQALEERIIDLREKQRSLELEGANLRSIQTIEERAQNLSLITSDQVAYLSQDTERVAALAN